MSALEWVAGSDPGPFTYLAYGGASYSDQGTAAAYGNGEYLVSCINNLLHSTDGITWTTSAAIIPDSQPFSGAPSYVDALIWVERLGLWLAAPGRYEGTDSLYTSTNGTTWVGHSTPFDYEFIACFADNGSLLVAGGETGGGVEVLATSTDGVSWTPRSSPADYASVSGLAWSSALGLWVAAVDGGPTVLMTSSDGTTWSSALTTGSYAGKVCWSPELGLFVWAARATASGCIFTSPDGSTWTHHPVSDLDSAGATDAIWSSDLGLFVVGRQDVLVYTSPDGTTWSSNEIFTDFWATAFAAKPGAGVDVVAAGNTPANLAFTPTARVIIRSLPSGIHIDTAF